MTRDAEREQDWIEDARLGRLDPASQAEFEHRLREDKAFAEEVHSFDRLQRELKAFGLMSPPKGAADQCLSAFRAQISAPSESAALPPRRSWFRTGFSPRLRVAAALLLFLGIAALAVREFAGGLSDQTRAGALADGLQSDASAAPNAMPNAAPPEAAADLEAEKESREWEGGFVAVPGAKKGKDDPEALGAIGEAETELLERSRAPSWVQFSAAEPSAQTLYACELQTLNQRAVETRLFFMRPESNISTIIEPTADDQALLSVFRALPAFDAEFLAHEDSPRLLFALEALDQRLTLVPPASDSQSGAAIRTITAIGRPLWPPRAVARWIAPRASSALEERFRDLEPALVRAGAAQTSWTGFAVGNQVDPSPWVGSFQDSSRLRICRLDLSPAAIDLLCADLESLPESSLIVWHKDAEARELILVTIER